MPLHAEGCLQESTHWSRQCARCCFHRLTTRLYRLELRLRVYQNGSYWFYIYTGLDKLFSSAGLKARPCNYTGLINYNPAASTACRRDLPRRSQCYTPTIHPLYTHYTIDNNRFVYRLLSIVYRLLSIVYWPPSPRLQ
jgi:hypothetical protein